MITIIIYGLDQFVVGDLSRDITKNIAKIYEVDEEEVNFVAPNSMIFHKGVEQTSWNVLVHVHAPLKLSVLQDQASEVIFSGIKGVGIHTTIEFYYYSVDNRVTRLNDDYPRYISEDNSVTVEDAEYNEDLEEGEEEDQIFTGDIFEEHHHHHDN